MRRVFLAAFVAGSAAVTLVAACSTFHDDPVDAIEAGTNDASMGDTDGGTDAADAADAYPLLPTRGLIDCFGNTCDLSTQIICCSDYDAGTSDCTTDMACAHTKLLCDDKADCAASQVCCLNSFAETKCSESCSPTDSFFPTYQLCRSNAECGEGTDCVPVDCSRASIGVCGAAASKVRMECNPDAAAAP